MRRPRTAIRDTDERVAYGSGRQLTGFHGRPALRPGGQNSP